MTITAIIPAYNNEVPIGTQLLITRKNAKHAMLVNDGSKDRTVKVAQLAGAEIILHTMSRMINENRIVKKVSKGETA